MGSDIFQSFLMGGFECSTHRASNTKRLDLITATKHDLFAESDYRLLFDNGFSTARDGTRWHLIETSPYQYDFSSVLPQIRAARQVGIQIIWDLFHYGYPDDLDIFSEDFVNRFAAYAKAFAELLVSEGERAPLFCLVNEISFFAWAAGEVGFFYPFEKNRGAELMRQLIRASIAASIEIRRAAPQSVLIQIDPVINVVPLSSEHAGDAVRIHNGQYYALDMLIGKTEPELGGSPQHFDVIGINYYPYNQWRHPCGTRIMRGEKEYRAFSDILKEYSDRYQKPLFVAETGIEDDARAEWFRYICQEVRDAQLLGASVNGICLYPILNHPGWDDDRHCHNGLWDYADENGQREIHTPLADEIKHAVSLFQARAAVA